MFPNIYLRVSCEFEANCRNVSTIFKSRFLHTPLAPYVYPESLRVIIRTLSQILTLMGRNFVSLLSFAARITTYLPVMSCLIMASFQVFLGFWSPFTVTISPTLGYCIDFGRHGHVLERLTTNGLIHRPISLVCTLNDVWLSQIFLFDEMMIVLFQFTNVSCFVGVQHCCEHLSIHSPK